MAHCKRAKKVITAGGEGVGVPTEYSCCDRSTRRVHDVAQTIIILCS